MFFLSVAKGFGEQPSEEPAWKKRSVERSIKTAKLRAAQRVQRFLDAAQAIITEKGTTDFTVQEVVDRSIITTQFLSAVRRQARTPAGTLRGCLEPSRRPDRAATSGQADPLDQLKVAIELLFELSRPDPTAKRPLFTDFAPQLLISHPTEVGCAFLAYLVVRRTDGKAGAAGKLRSDVNPRMAAMTMQTVMFIAQSSGAPDDETVKPISADEVWNFCAMGFAAGQR